MAAQELSPKEATSSTAPAAHHGHPAITHQPETNKLNKWQAGTNFSG